MDISDELYSYLVGIVKTNLRSKYEVDPRDVINEVVSEVLSENKDISTGELVQKVIMKARRFTTDAAVERAHLAELTDGLAELYPDPGSPDDDYQAARDQRDELVRRAIDLLTPRARQIMELYHEHGADAAVVARALGITPRTVYNVVSTSREAIKNWLEDLVKPGIIEHLRLVEPRDTWGGIFRASLARPDELHRPPPEKPPDSTESPSDERSEQTSDSGQ